MRRRCARAARRNLDDQWSAGFAAGFQLLTIIQNIYIFWNIGIDRIHLRLPGQLLKLETLKSASEQPFMAKSMEIVPSSELQKQFGRYSDEAMIRPVGVSRNGRVRFVMVPIEDYDRMRRRERVAGRAEDLDDNTLEAIRAVQPAAECDVAEAQLGTA
jgi:prevent-host-death family protein